MELFLFKIIFHLIETTWKQNFPYAFKALVHNREWICFTPAYPSWWKKCYFLIPDSFECNRSLKVVLRELVQDGGRIYEFRKLFGETPSTKGTGRSEKDFVWKTSQVSFSSQPRQSREHSVLDYFSIDSCTMHQRELVCWNCKLRWIANVL